MDLKKRWLALLVGLTIVGAGPAAAQLDAGLPLGSKAPLITINDLDGKPLELASLIGKKPVMLEFWATWCAVCKALLPKVEQVHARFGEQISIVGVNITVNESKERVRRYLDVHKPPFIALYDDKGAGSRAYDVPTTGFIVIIDRLGKIAYTGSGEDQDLVGAMAKVVAR